MDMDLQNALNTQFNVERQNAVEYQCRGDYLDGLAWDGMAHFMRKSADDERSHAQKFADYMIARNIVPQHLGTRAVLTSSVQTPLQYFTDVYDLEVMTTQKINDLYRLADDADDPQSCQFLHWFLQEQTESVKQTWDMVQEITRAQDDDAALLALDEKYSEL